VTAKGKDLRQNQANERQPPINKQQNDRSDRQYICQMMQSLIDGILMRCNEMGFRLLEVAQCSPLQVNF
jgi:hypothetical protein